MAANKSLRHFSNINKALCLYCKNSSNVLMSSFADRPGF